MAVRKFCNFCRMQVPMQATVCPHCTREIDTPEAIRVWEIKEKRRKMIRNVILVIVALALIAFAKRH